MASFVTLADEGNIHAYAATELLQPLVAGTEYCLRMYVSQADSCRYRVGTLHAFLWYGLPAICNFNDTAWDTYAAATFDLTGVSVNGWHLLEANIVADGGESSLTLGTFLFGSEFDTVYVGDLPINNATYYFDDLYLGPCDVGHQELNEGLDLGVRVEGRRVFVTSAANVRARIGLIDALGRDLGQREIAPRGQVYFDDLVPGQYFLRCSRSNGLTEVARIVVP